MFDIKKQFFSKGAIAGVPIFDAGIAAYEAAAMNKPIKEAVSDTLSFGSIPRAMGVGMDTSQVIQAKKLLNKIKKPNDEVIYWLWLPGLAMFFVSIASSSLHLLISDLRRAGASVASLLLLVLIWPFLQLTDSLEMIITDGISLGFSLDEPIFMILLAGMISILVWFVSTYLPDT